MDAVEGVFGSGRIAPEFVAGTRATLQSLVPVRLRVVYPPAVVAAEAIWKTIHLDFALPALGGAVDQLHDELHHLLGRPLRRLVKLLHHRLLLFFLLLHVAQFRRPLPPPARPCDGVDPPRKTLLFPRMAS